MYFNFIANLGFAPKKNGFGEVITLIRHSPSKQGASLDGGNNVRACQSVHCMATHMYTD